MQLRGVRARLVSTYLLAAIVLAAGGATLLTVTLSRGLRASVDAALQTRAHTLAADLTAGNVEQGDPPTIGPTGHHAAAVLAFTAVYGPGGKLIDAQPSSLPTPPLSAGQATHPSASATFRTTRFSGESFRILAQPVQLPDGTWVVVVGESLGAADEAAAQVRRALAVAVPILLVLVGLGAWLLSGAALKPVDRMRADAQALGEHNPGGRITEPATRDSLNQLARTFNALLDRLHHSLDRQRSLVADAGHELRTPLAVLQTELETAVRATHSRADLIDSINHARLEVARLAALSEDLLLLAQDGGGQQIVRPQLTDVSELLDHVVDAHRDRAAECAVTLELTRSSALIADLDPVALRRILDNLLANALRHSPPGGTVTIAADTEHGTGRAGSDGRSLLVLRVSDAGPGFPADFLPRVFDRFARADQGRSRASAAAGNGLGLAIVDTLVRAHRGTVSAANGPAGGAVLELRLPLFGEETPLPPPHR